MKRLFVQTERRADRLPWRTGMLVQGRLQMVMPDDDTSEQGKNLFARTGHCQAAGNPLLSFVFPISILFSFFTFFSISVNGFGARKANDSAVPNKTPNP